MCKLACKPDVSMCKLHSIKHAGTCGWQVVQCTLHLSGTKCILTTGNLLTLLFSQWKEYSQGNDLLEAKETKKVCMTKFMSLQINLFVQRCQIKIYEDMSGPI